MTSKLISGVLLGVLVFIASMTVEAADFSGWWKGTLSGSVACGWRCASVVVKSVEKRQGRLSVDLLFSFEKASQGYLQQKQETALFEYALVPDGLKIRVTTQATSHFGDKDMIVGGDPNSAVVEGVLQKGH